MPRSPRRSPVPAGSDQDVAAAREIIGYLNFSNGQPDVAFQRALNALAATLDASPPWPALSQELRRQLETVRGREPAFADLTQASAAIELVFDHLWPAYRAFHRDLLFHLDDAQMQNAFLAARFFEAVLAEGPPWDETDRIVRGALQRLNDFIGYRPVAVLENGRQMQPYPHEYHRPLPLYIPGAGVAYGPYHELIAEALEFLQQVPEDLLAGAYFDLHQLRELAVDLRAHDHTHPVYRRTNYMFGEWDPHRIDAGGRYERFVIRRIILQALTQWIEQQPERERDEARFDAAVVLCGTMLMASAVSGSGPDTHTSEVSLSSLLPRIATHRDAFYDRALRSTSGPRRRRLERLAEKTRQPFGHVRQQLNLFLNEYGARQLQRHHLAVLFARLGQFEMAREFAAAIPSVSSRMETEIQARLTGCLLQTEEGELSAACELLEQATDFLHRGIECGGLLDPWNLLGFHGHFPLFHAREDAFPDPRAETLLELMQSLFSAHAAVWAEAAAQGRKDLAARVEGAFADLANFWDQFASYVVEDLPRVVGQEYFTAAASVAAALAQWRTAGAAAGNIRFWQEHVEHFQSAKAYADVVLALLNRGDFIASRALLMQWLSEADQVSLEQGSHSFFVLALEWIRRFTAPLLQETSCGDASQAADRTELPAEELWGQLRRLFAFLEPNAGEYWHVPRLSEFTDEPLGTAGRNDVHPHFLEFAEADDDTEEADQWDEASGWTDEDDEQDERSSLFEAAYEEWSFRDSADDGVEGSVADSHFGHETTEFERLMRRLEPRLKFVGMLAQLRQYAAAALAVVTADDRSAAQTLPHFEDTLTEWIRHTRQLQRELRVLLRDVWEYPVPAPSGDLDSGIEYDANVQMQYFIVHTIIAMHVNCRVAELALRCLLPEEPHGEAPGQQEAPYDREMVRTYRCVLQRDVAALRRQLPHTVSVLMGKPLLYQPLDQGGSPDDILAVRTVQTDIRFLLRQLPRLGLLRETYHLLRTAQRMQRLRRPRGSAVTEFDNLFRTAWENVVECIVVNYRQWCERDAPSGTWAADGDPDRGLLEIIQQCLVPFRRLWVQHARTMRLSAAETLTVPDVLEELKDFITRYGADLFHPAKMPLGHVRSVLQHGVENYLRFLEENVHPVEPIRLIDDIHDGVIPRRLAANTLELIFNCYVDRFERYVEYNNTTTQSDYGDRFWYFLELIAVEAKYDRSAWLRVPLRIVHEVLASHRLRRAMELWERFVEAESAAQAEVHLKELADVERRLGICLPSIRDRIGERFLRPLAVNRMVALIPRCIQDVHRRVPGSPHCCELKEEINRYMEQSVGCGTEVPGWLKRLEREVHARDVTAAGLDRSTSTLRLGLPIRTLSPADLQQQLRTLTTSPFRKSGRRRKS